jgi:hypothetical protein
MKHLSAAGNDGKATPRNGSVARFVQVRTFQSSFKYDLSLIT